MKKQKSPIVIFKESGRVYRGSWDLGEAVVLQGILPSTIFVYDFVDLPHLSALQFQASSPSLLLLVWRARWSAVWLSRIRHLECRLKGPPDVRLPWWEIKWGGSSIKFLSTSYSCFATFGQDRHNVMMSWWYLFFFSGVQYTQGTQSGKNQGCPQHPARVHGSY